MPTIIYVEHHGAEHRVDVSIGQSIMEGAVKNGVPGILAECGGSCTCATCHVYVEADERKGVLAPSKSELELLEFLDNRTELSRLSCQIKVKPEMEELFVILPEYQG